jgi:Asp-tRNA(Asn)/Glu-tRNA(Gln) amidotransferase A subunit family amidase
VEYTLASSRFSFDTFKAYMATSFTIRDRLIESWNDTNAHFTALGCKRVSYLSLEFLMGRSMQNALLNMDLEENYKKALQVRTLIKQDYDRAFERFDVLLSPTAPTTAFKFGEKTDDPLAMYLADIATIPVNLAGVPALSLNGGFDAEGLPIGLQLIARPLGEATLYRTAHAFEQATAHHLRRPTL